MNLCSISISTSLYISRRPRQSGPAFFNTDVTSILYNNTLGGDVFTNDNIRPNCISPLQAQRKEQKLLFLLQSNFEEVQ